MTKLNGFQILWKENVDIFGKQATNATPIMVDNEAALRVANHPSATPKSKFVALREFRIRDYQEEGICNLKPLWVPGTQTVLSILLMDLPPDCLVLIYFLNLQDYLACLQ